MKRSVKFQAPSRGTYRIYAPPERQVICYSAVHYAEQTYNGIDEAAVDILVESTDTPAVTSHAPVAMAQGEWSTAPTESTMAERDVSTIPMAVEQLTSPAVEPDVSETQPVLDGPTSSTERAAGDKNTATPPLEENILLLQKLQNDHAKELAQFRIALEAIQLAQTSSSAALKEDEAGTSSRMQMEQLIQDQMEQLTRLRIDFEKLSQQSVNQNNDTEATMRRVREQTDEVRATLDAFAKRTIEGSSVVDDDVQRMKMLLQDLQQHQARMSMAQEQFEAQTRRLDATVMDQYASVLKSVEEQITQVQSAVQEAKENAHGAHNIVEAVRESVQIQQARLDDVHSTIKGCETKMGLVLNSVDEHSAQISKVTEVVADQRGQLGSVQNTQAQQMDQVARLAEDHQKTIAQLGAVMDTQQHQLGHVQQSIKSVGGVLDAQQQRIEQQQHQISEVVVSAEQHQAAIGNLSSMLGAHQQKTDNQTQTIDRLSQSLEGQYRAMETFGDVLGEHQQQLKEMTGLVGSLEDTLEVQEQQIGGHQNLLQVHDAKINHVNRSMDAHRQLIGNLGNTLGNQQRSVEAIQRSVQTHQGMIGRVQTGVLGCTQRIDRVSQTVQEQASHVESVSMSAQHQSMCISQVQEAVRLHGTDMEHMSARMSQVQESVRLQGAEMEHVCTTVKTQHDQLGQIDTAVTQTQDQMHRLRFAVDQQDATVRRTRLDTTAQLDRVISTLNDQDAQLTHLATQQEQLIRTCAEIPKTVVVGEPKPVVAHGVAPYPKGNSEELEYAYYFGSHPSVGSWRLCELDVKDRGRILAIQVMSQTDDASRPVWITAQYFGSPSGPFQNPEHAVEQTSSPADDETHTALPRGFVLVDTNDDIVDADVDSADSPVASDDEYVVGSGFSRDDPTMPSIEDALIEVLHEAIRTTTSQSSPPAPSQHVAASDEVPAALGYSYSSNTHRHAPPASHSATHDSSKMSKSKSLDHSQLRKSKSQKSANDSKRHANDNVDSVVNGYLYTALQAIKARFGYQMP